MPIIRYPCSNIFVALIHLCSRYIFEDDKRERILKIHKLILSYVLGLLGSALMADNHELIGGLNPSEPFALNVSHCNLKPGKTMNQVDKLVKPSGYFRPHPRHCKIFLMVRQILF